MQMCYRCSLCREENCREVSCLDCVALECYIWPYVLMSVLFALPVAGTLNEPGDCKEARGVL